MKKLLLLLCIMSVFASCEDIQDNSPAFQADLNEISYKSIETQAIVADDGSVAIIGATTDEILTLSLTVLQRGAFVLNDTNGHQAYYEDGSGQVYSTENGGSGIVNITSRGTVDGNEVITGDFAFQAILTGLDTVTLNKGLFFQVPVVSGTIEDPGMEDPDPNLDGSLIAEIDGVLFEPTTVVSSTTDTSIIITGALGDDTVQLVIPIDAVAGLESIPGNGFNASYFISGVEEPAVSGGIRIFNNDMTAQTLTGTFNFTTENHQISLGQFNIDY